MLNEINELSLRIKAAISAWYLTHENDYSSCETCGYDDTKPDCGTIQMIIDKETKKYYNELGGLLK